MKLFAFWRVTAFVCGARQVVKRAEKYFLAYTSFCMQKTAE